MVDSVHALAGRAGAHISWARTEDRAARTRNGRQAFLDKFFAEVDPAGTLTAEERAIRAEHALKGYMAQLALRSAKARRRAARLRAEDEAEQAEAALDELAGGAA